MGVLSGVIGGIIATVPLSWLAGRAHRQARVEGDLQVLEYGRPVRIAGWAFLMLGLFFLYAAAHASRNQMMLAWCVGGTLFASSLALFLEFHFARIEFDSEFIYTFSPWRKSRRIPWSAIIGYAYSEVNKWHILKTNSHGYVRLSILFSGLGSMAEELKKRGLHGYSSSILRSG